MQNIELNMRTDSVRAVMVDAYNIPVAVDLPSIARGMKCRFSIGLFDDGDATGYSETVRHYASWDFGLGNDWDTGTSPQMRVTSGFEFDEDGRLTFTMTDTNTQELIDFLGNSEEASLHAELLAYEAGDPEHPALILQWDMWVRGRILDGGTGEPQPVDDRSYNKAQVNSLVSAAYEFAFSPDGSSWHPLPQLDTDSWFRIRNGSLTTGQWSDSIRIPQGNASYVYLAYASDSQGSDFSLSWVEGLDWMAVLVSHVEIQDPGPSDFSGCTWMKTVGQTPYLYIGYAETSSGSGFSLVPSDSKPYTAHLASSVPLDPPTAQDFEGCTWVRYIVRNYIYTAYASAPDGSGFSLVPSSGLKYTASFNSIEYIASPTVADFNRAHAVWVKYIGDDGTGIGDMLKTVYDPDDDGKVTAAVFADSAASCDSVPWSGITGRPASCRQSVSTVQDAESLDIDSPIAIAGSDLSGSSLSIDVRSFTSGGSPYVGQAGDFFTWEYHVRATSEITNISVGSSYSTSYPVSIPESLPLVSPDGTWHVFTIRAIYRQSAVNRLAVYVNYAYSYEGGR